MSFLRRSWLLFVLFRNEDKSTGFTRITNNKLVGMHCDVTGIFTGNCVCVRKTYTMCADETFCVYEEF